MSTPSPASAYQEFRDVRWFGSLDGLRAVSVLAVVWHHTAGTGQPGVAGRGHLGVEMFFAISGFLITTLLLRERARHGRISLRDFYVRRSLRIFPLYYATLAVYVLLTALTGRRDEPAGEQFLDHLPAFLTYTSNWFVGFGQDVTFYFAWSLATEEQFYLFWPPLLAGLLHLARGRPGPPLLALGLLLVTDSVVTAQTAPGSRSLPAVVLVSLAAPILFGSGLALVLHSPTGFRIAARAIGRCWMPAALLAAVLAAVAIGAAEPVIAFAMALLVASCCSREDHALSPFLRAVPLRSIGVVSYGVYLLHQLSANAVQAALEVPEGPVLFLATLPPVLLVSWLSHRFFERPLLVLRHRFTGDVAAAIPSPGMPAVRPGLRAAEAQP